MTLKPNVYLVGYRCTGKTTIGRQLSEKTGRPFHDTDKIIMSRIDDTIEHFVNKKGWSEFRRMEKKVLMDLGALTGLIVSTGGGIVLDKDNRRILNTTGTVIWLDADIKTILKRMLADPGSKANRPMLSRNDPESDISITMRERRHLYQDVSDIKVDTSIDSPGRICDLILKSVILF